MMIRGRRISAKWPALSAGAMLLAILSSRIGVIWILHDYRTWIELDTGALHVGWVRQSVAFAASGVELLRGDGWNWTGWLPRVELADPARGYLAVPIWIMALSLLSPALVQWFLQARGAERGCGTCGYDLRGNRSGICPECGALIPAR